LSAGPQRLVKIFARLGQPKHLRIRWKGPRCTPDDTPQIIRQGHVIGKEYQSGIAVKARGLRAKLLRMARW
jgi:hypothetical protein